VPRSARAGGKLTATHRFSDASDVWWRKLKALVGEGNRSPGTLQTYGGVLAKDVKPALDELRLGEFNTPLVDAFILHIRQTVGAATAKLCRSIVSGVLGVAVRAGALSANPVREVEPIEVNHTKRPRALTAAERTQWFETLRSDPVAVRKDLPDLTAFMLATGVRIGEALAVIWSEIDLD
jgi:integrase